MKQRPNILVILIDDLRYDEFGAGGHPYMKTPHIDRIAREGALFERAFHTTPICSPNRAPMLTGQAAARPACSPPHPRLVPARTVGEPPRDHRQRGAGSREPPHSQLPRRAAAAG